MKNVYKTNESVKNSYQLGVDRTNKAIQEKEWNECKNNLPKNMVSKRHI